MRADNNKMPGNIVKSSVLTWDDMGSLFTTVHSYMSIIAGNTPTFNSKIDWDPTAQLTNIYKFTQHTHTHTRAANKVVDSNSLSLDQTLAKSLNQMREVVELKSQNI